MRENLASKAGPEHAEKSIGGHEWPDIGLFCVEMLLRQNGPVGIFQRQQPDEKGVALRQWDGWLPVLALLAVTTWRLNWPVSHRFYCVPADYVLRVPMRFSQIDRIIEIEPGERLTAVKTLALSEEYLKDHFPRFPVMPGVLMLEAAFQAAMYLIRIEEDFAHSMVVLEEAKNLKFQGFVQPGDRLIVKVQIKSRDGNSIRFRIDGEIEGRTAVSGFITIGCFNLADRGMAAVATDNHMRSEFRKNSRLLFNQVAEKQSRE